MPTSSRTRSGSVGILLAAGFSAIVASPVWAAGEDASGRYTMSPTEGGVIRLDRETGAMSFCSGAAGNWSCKDMPETENALKKRLEELEAENRALEAEKQLRGAPPPGPSATAPEAAVPPGEAPPPAPPGDLPIPNERDVDKLFDYVEGMMKKFKERIERLEREAKKDPAVPL
ncbi:hypothetical protein [uncultured Hyphomicrobium sp.]|uniref:hypothetical protein n=1 Tax=uncultured Hyphomicrobium sp. TaxID=194373 RepID=UPI0025D00976|nr:hypothetical protein [uncultured Hyphomicrobium sp.]